MDKFWKNIRAGLRKSVCFRGKADRGEFWRWVLFVVCGYLLLLAVEALFLIIRARIDSRDIGNALVWIGGIVFFAFLLFSMLSVLAVGARRLRDAGYRPWLIVVPFLLLIGSYHPVLDFALSGMDDTPPEIPLSLSFAYQVITAFVCLFYVVLLSQKSR